MVLAGIVEVLRKQCAAVSTQVGVIRDPEQSLTVSPEVVSTRTTNLEKGSGVPVTAKLARGREVRAITSRKKRSRILRKRGAV
jgi:hypothetical protein